MKKKLLSSSKKNNSTISFVIVLVLLIIYLQNNKLYLPAIEKVISFTIIEEKETEYNSGGRYKKAIFMARRCTFKVLNNGGERCNETFIHY